MILWYLSKELKKKKFTMSGKDCGDGESSVLCYNNGTDWEADEAENFFIVIVARKGTCGSSSFTVVSDPKKVLSCCGAATSTSHVAVMVSHKWEHVSREEYGALACTDRKNWTSLEHVSLFWLRRASPSSLVCSSFISMSNERHCFILKTLLFLLPHFLVASVIFQMICSI